MEIGGIPRFGTVFGAAEGLKDGRILGNIFLEFYPVVSPARDEYDSGGCGLFVGCFDHEREETNGEKGGGEAVDLNSGKLSNKAGMCE